MTYTRVTRSLRILAIVLSLTSACMAQTTTFGCQVNNEGCNDHGTCEQFGFCTCQEGYFGEFCAEKSSNQTLKSSLAKGFITFWVLFWIIINFLVPYLICLLIMYLRKKNCDQVKEHLSTCKEAFFCCIKKAEVKTNRNNLAREPSIINHAEIEGNGEIAQLRAENDPNPKPENPSPKPEDPNPKPEEVIKKAAAGRQLALGLASKPQRDNSTANVEVRAPVVNMPAINARQPRRNSLSAV